MIQRKVNLTANREIARDYFELRFLFSFSERETPLPGQFLTLKISDGPAPLLRRPFAFSAYRNGTAGVIYQRRGPGTELLAGKREGDELDIIAPLGNTWPEPGTKEHPVLVAGGIGMGPILFFARSLQQKGRNFSLIIGARTGDYLPDSTVTAGLDTLLATDDGSIGIHGTVIDALPSEYPSPPRFYTCGPHPMMYAVHRQALELDAPCSVSMEQTIACGVGACMGCVIRLTGDERFARVCADGPIFDSREVLWN
ncbi:dihydroorotate dehydrogenase electron transfer subunit [Marispirochaeta sp.]|uniref:dihydroorotate dehydrogenase electron transfer subunit n=1 Tax=Marispirochaeta sp. TaxID=2038653 RepID=UPI0029C612C1|nr:dihydroorotate dehydrogenase electron transfer subunit [Marispirochaeta sp.]